MTPATPEAAPLSSRPVPGGGPDGILPVTRRGRRGGRPPRKPSLGRRIFRWAVRLIVGLMLLVLAALLWLGSETGLQHALGWAQQLLVRFDQALAVEQVEGNLWRGIRIGRVEWRGAGMVVQGSGLKARWSLRALLRGHVVVHELQADRLMVQLPPSGPSGPRTDVPMPGQFGLPVPLELRRLRVDHFELLPAAEGKATPQPLLVLDDVQAAAAYALGQYQITGLSLTSPWGRVHEATAQMDAAPPHRIKAAIRADGSLQQWPYLLNLSADGDLDRLPLKVDGQLAEGQAEVAGVVRPLARIPVERLHVRIADANLARFAAAGALPETGLDLDLDLDPVAGRDDTWQGRLRVFNRQAGALDASRLPLRSLQTDIHLLLPPADRWVQAQVVLDGLQAALPVSATTHDGKVVVASQREARIQGGLHLWPGRELKLPGVVLPQLKAGLKLGGLDLAPLAKGLPPTALEGQVQVDGQRFLVDLAQDVERLRALLPPELQQAAGDAHLKVAGTLDERWLKLAEANAALGEARLAASGQMSVDTPHALSLKGTLRQLDLARWLPASVPVDARWREGVLGADWSVDGQLMAPGHKARLSLDLVDAQVAGKPLVGRLRASPELNAEGLPVQLGGVELLLAHGQATRIEAKGALGRPDDRLDLKVLASALDRLDSRLGGQLALTGQLAGRLDALRASLSGQGDELSVQLPAAEGKTAPGAAAASRLRIRSVRLSAQAPLAFDKPGSLEQPLALDVALQQLSLGEQRIERLRLDLQGSAAQHQLSLTGARGRDRLHVQSEGRLSMPRQGFRYQADLGTFDLSGRASVRLQEPARVNVHGQGLDTRNLQLSLLGGRMQLAHLLLDWSRAFNFDTVGRVDGVQPLQLRRLMEMDDGQDLSVLEALRVAASWQLRGQGAEALHGEARLTLTEQPAVGQRQRLGLRADNGAVMRFEGEKLDGRLRLDLPSLAVANPFLGSDLALDGSATVDGVIKGKLHEPVFDVALKGKALQVLQRSAGFALRQGSLDARLDNQSLVLNRLHFVAGEGSLQIKGAARVVERPGLQTDASPDEIEAAARRRQRGPRQASVLPMDGVFDVVLDRFLVPVGPGQKVTVSGQTRLSSTARGLELTGDVRVDEGLIEIQGSGAPSLPDDVKVVNETVPSEETPAGADDAALRIRSALGIALGEKLKIVGMGAQVRLGGDLELSGFLPSEPQLTGLVRILDGSYQAYGQDLKFTKGLVRFNGPINNPSLDLEAKRPFLPVDVGLAITGLASNPQVTLVSKPSMSETTKLSWLVLGVPPEEASGAAQSLALQQAGTLLFGGDDGRPSPTIADRLGLDVFNYGYASDTGVEAGVQESMTPKGVLSGSSSDNTGAETGVVSLGKRINDRLFVSYEKGVRGVWNLLRIQYTLGKGYVLRAQTGTENSLDVLRTRNFD